MHRRFCVALLTLGVLVLGSACGANPRAAATIPAAVHPHPALATLTTYVATARVEPGTPKSVSVSCRPGEQMLGGGFETGDLFEYAADIQASYPSGAATWTVTGAAPASYFALEAEVYCLPETIPLGLLVVHAAGATAVPITCPPHTVLLGGGFQAALSASVSRPQGNGWFAADPSALCAARHVAGGRVVRASFNAHSSSHSSAPDSAEVACPRGQIAVGGGFAGGGDLVVGSQTLGQSFAGWSVAAGGDADLSLFAVCVLLQV